MAGLEGCFIVGPNGIKYRLVEMADSAPPLAPAKLILDHSKPIGPQLKAAREGTGLSLRKFAKLAEIGYVSLCKAENRTGSPRKSTLLAIETALQKLVVNKL